MGALNLLTLQCISMLTLQQYVTESAARESVYWIMYQSKLFERGLFMLLDRSHDYDLYVILKKIKENQRITFADRIKIGEIKARLDTKSYLEENETQQAIMQDIAGKLYYK